MEDFPRTARVVGVRRVAHHRPKRVEQIFGCRSIIGMECGFQVISGRVGADLLGPATVRARIGKSESARRNEQFASHRRKDRGAGRGIGSATQDCQSVSFLRKEVLVRVSQIEGL